MKRQLNLLVRPLTVPKRLPAISPAIFSERNGC
jgi:hypothetical protein